MGKKIDIQGMNLEVTKSMNEYLEKKLQRATKNSSDFISAIKVNLASENRTGTYLVEVILFLHGGKTICNKTHSPEMYASMDIACASLERQIKKLKEKHLDIRRYQSIEGKINLMPDLVAVAS
ncbi:MAG: ribosome hibernation-promoting factor, HPF/YfiA family [Candidatus Melainabacteria bacterium]|jgi:ribosomal subunit interface protein